MGCLPWRLTFASPLLVFLPRSYRSHPYIAQGAFASAVWPQPKRPALVRGLDKEAAANAGLARPRPD